jgi:hypothetical protein
MAAKMTIYSLSFNPNIIDKPDRAGLDFSRGFVPIEATIDDVAGHIRHGQAISAQYENGHRRGKNFIKCSFLAADVDGGMSLEDALDHAVVRHHAGLIHTTVSHTPERHRFRILFFLDEPIADGRDWADAQLGTAVTFGSDRSVSDAARLFFGNRNATMTRLPKTMPPSFVALLIARGKDARAQKLAPASGEWSVNSVRRIGPGELVKLASGELRRIDELKAGDGVHCPSHDDANPSAFVVKSMRGSLGIHCSACKVTVWPDDVLDSYDFGGFERLFERFLSTERPSEEEQVGFDRFFPPQPKFVRLSAPYLPELDYHPGLTFVRSPKGSGKTEALVKLLEWIRASSKKDRPKSVLLIGHRRTLLREAAAKLGMRCYLDDESPNEKLITLAVSLDSLHKYSEAKPGWRRPKGGFDLVIIDEVEQVLKHLLSKTIEQRAGLQKCFDALDFEVSNAKSVMVLDADLGLLAAHAMRVMRRRDWEDNCRIIYNAPIAAAQKRTMRLFSDRKSLEREVIDAIRRGQRCFITSNSKEFVLNVERMIRNECGDGIVMRVVTGDNSHEEPVIRFVKNIKTEFLLVQVVATSPSMGTGIDITFPEGACMVDRVFGFFYSMVNTHTDIDQQLCRVRNPGMVDVWISPTTFNFTCNVEVVKDDLARAYTVQRAVRGRRREDGMVDYDRDDPLLTVCAHVTALERASKNRLVQLFCQLREANGWAIERVDAKEKESPYDEARQQRKEERAALLLNAPALTDDDFIDLDARLSAGHVLSPEERAAREKHIFETTVGLPLDAELVSMNLDGKLIERVQTLAAIATIWSRPYLDDLFDLLAEPTGLPKGRLQKMTPDRMIGVLMRIAGLTDSTGIKAGHVVVATGLADFARVCQENQTVIEEVLGDALRADFRQNPVRQLNRFLTRVGLRLEGLRTEKTKDGGKLRYYSLSLSLAGRMMSLAAAYSEVQRRRENDRKETGFTRRDQTPQQGTAEKPGYMHTNMDLLSLIDPK